MDNKTVQNGLLEKRGELFREAERLTERLAEIKNQIKSLDKALIVMGYEGDLDSIMPRQRRQVIFGKGELLEALMLELRCAERPLKSRELAQNVLASSGEDIRDRKAVSDLTRRISKCLRVQRQRGLVLAKMDEARCLNWMIRPRVG